MYVKQLDGRTSIPTAVEREYTEFLFFTEKYVNMRLT